MNFWKPPSHGKPAQKCSATEFVASWSDRYYDYTPISDKLYYHGLDLITSGRDPGAGVMLLGAWKANCLSTHQRYRGEGVDAFLCRCGATYYFTRVWKAGTSAGYEVWLNLALQAGALASCLAAEPPSCYALGRKLVPSWSETRYNGPCNPETRFGVSYAVMALHALCRGRYPIWDRFNQLGLEITRIEGTTPPSPGMRKAVPVASLDDYFGHFIPGFENIKATSGAEDRAVDRALWSLGHFVADSKKRQGVCCPD